MDDYFLISSPLHFCLAASVALGHPDHRNTAVIVAKHADLATAYAAAARGCPDIFAAVHVLTLDLERGSLRSRAEMRRTIDALFSKGGDMRIFTGDDRRLEYQYAMHVATRAGARVEGIYLDDGVVTYVGHKALRSPRRRFLRPLVRKLVHGWWFKDTAMLGLSDWTSSAFVAFPDAVHPMLRRKKLVALDVTPLRGPGFLRLVSGLAENAAALRLELAEVRVIVSLPKEVHYLNHPEPYQRLWSQLTAVVDPSCIAIKPHPRSSRLDVLATMFPGAHVVDKRIGWEFLLVLLPEGCAVVGDVSSTMITTRWIRPDLPVVAIRPENGLAAVRQAFYDTLRIPVVEASEIGRWLQPRPTAVSPDPSPKVPAT